MHKKKKNVFSKKAQTDLSMGVTIRTLFNVILFIVLMGIAFKLIYGAFIKKDNISTPEKDLRRVIAEMADLRKGDYIKVPVLYSSGDEKPEEYEILVITTELAVDSRISKCRLDKGNYCACLRRQDTIETCIAFKLNYEFDPDHYIAKIEREKGVILDFTNERAYLTSGS